MNINRINQFLSNKKLFSYLILLIGFCLLIIPLLFYLYKNTIVASFSNLNYEPVIKQPIPDFTQELIVLDNITGTFPSNSNGLDLNLINTNDIIQASPTDFNMYPTSIKPLDWSLDLQIDQIIIPKDFIDLKYYDKWTSFYLDKKFLVHGISKLNKIYIPSISVQSALDPLEIKDIGDSTEYETPNKIVGYIPSTLYPNKNNFWFFGHLESPLYREGSIFKHLPDIPNLLRSGEDLFIYFDDVNFIYKYKIKSTKVFHKDELTLYDSDSYTITLVTCIPRWIYDHRLVVTAELYSYAAK